MEQTVKELAALNIILANTSLMDLIRAAAVGYKELAKTDSTSNASELNLICTAALASLLWSIR